MNPVSVAHSPTAQPQAALQLLLGDEEFLLARAIAALAAATKAAHPDCEMTDVVAAEVSPGQWGQLLSPSLFGEHRVLVVRQAHEAAKDTADALLGWLTKLPSNLVVIVCHAGGNRGKAVVTAARAAGAQVISCAKLSSYRDRLGFVRAELERFGDSRRVSGDVAGLLLDSVGAGLRELSSACQQLMADTTGDVSSQTVRRYYHGKADVTGFAVADAVMVGDVAAALESLRWAVSVGVDPILVADALAEGVRSVARVSAAGRGNAYQLAGTLGMPPWKVERVQRQSRGWSQMALAAAARHAAVVNSAVKGGAEDRVYVLERAVIEMIAVRND